MNSTPLDRQGWRTRAIAVLPLLSALLTTPAPAAPPSRSKLSLHVLGSYTPGAQTVIAAHPPVLKIVDTSLIQAVRDYKTSTPAGLTVLRIYTPRTWTRATPAADAATDYWNTVLAPPLNALSAGDRALIDYVEGPNEGDSTPAWASADDTVWYNNFWLKLAQLIADAGFKPCAYAIAVGNPPGSAAEIHASLDRIAPSLTYIKSRGGAWSYHNYTIQYTTNPAVENFYSLRHRMYYDYFQTSHPNLVDLPIIMTEGGVDGPGAWTERGTAQDFQNWLTWLDNELRPESRVLGVTLFQIGNTTDWNRFNVEPVAPWLASHLDSFRAPGIGVNPSSLTVTAPAGTIPPAKSFTVRNTGSGVLQYSLIENQGWTTLSTYFGSSSGEEDLITVSFEPSVAGMSAGTYPVSIAVGHPEQSVVLPLTLTLTSTGTPVTQPFQVLPSWSTSFDAPWGSAAAFGIIGRAQIGSGLQASRTSAGSSARVQVFSVPANTSGTISVWIRCPSASASWWAECAWKAGSATAADFDGNPGSWTLVKKFADNGTTGNGNVWTQYSVPFNSGPETQISVGFKLGALNGSGPLVQWDELNIITSGAPAPVTITKSIAASADDAEERTFFGTVDLTSTDLELNFEPNPSSYQTVGLRFTGVEVPRGATILNGALQFKTDEIETAPSGITISAEAIDNAPPFVVSPKNISARARTTGVFWPIPAWLVPGEAGPPQRTSTLASAVQEVLDRPGWTSGNTLAFIITGYGRSHTAESFDKPGGTPPALSITYTTAPPRSFAQWMQAFPALNSAAAASDGNPDGDTLNNILEYALLLNPEQHDAPPYTLFRDNTSLFLNYACPSTARDLVIAVESSQSLDSGWNSNGITRQVFSDDGTVRTIQATIPALDPRTFVRLKVTLLP